MINFIINFLHKRLSSFNTKKYIEIGRNDICYCKSRKKFKHCHLNPLEKKGRIALYEIDTNTGVQKLKIYSKRKYQGTSTRFKTLLRGIDVKATDIALNDYYQDRS